MQPLPRALSPPSAPSPGTPGCSLRIQRACHEADHARRHRTCPPLRRKFVLRGFCCMPRSKTARACTSCPDCRRALPRLFMASSCVGSNRSACSYIEAAARSRAAS
eukprot:3457004-Rhodomonas_salina.2